MGNLGLQKTLNKFQFERTVDWRLKFPNLASQIKMVEPSVGDALENMYYRGCVFAQSVDIGTSMVINSGGAQAGFVDSKLSYPQVTVTLYTDADMILESALQIWCMSAFMEDGTMPVNVSSSEKTMEDNLIIDPVQTVVVQRIVPFRISKAFLSLIYDVPFLSGYTNLLDRNIVADGKSGQVLAEYNLKCYLTQEPRFNGTADANSVRTVTLQMEEVGFQRSFPTRSEYPLTRGSKLKQDTSLGSFVSSIGGALNTVVQTVGGETVIGALAGQAKWDNPLSLNVSHESGFGEEFWRKTR